jgi:hypothetical protein
MQNVISAPFEEGRGCFDGFFEKIHHFPVHKMGFSTTKTQLFQGFLTISAFCTFCKRKG